MTLTIVLTEKLRNEFEQFEEKVFDEEVRREEVRGEELDGNLSTEVEMLRGDLDAAIARIRDLEARLPSSQQASV
jgi:septin family protein